VAQRGKEIVRSGCAVYRGVTRGKKGGGTGFPSRRLMGGVVGKQTATLDTRPEKRKGMTMPAK